MSLFFMIYSAVFGLGFLTFGYFADTEKLMLQRFAIAICHFVLFAMWIVLRELEQREKREHQKIEKSISMLAADMRKEDENAKQ